MAPQSKPAERATILIVDDMPTNAVLLEALVKSLGNIDTVSFSRPEEALAWCRYHEPDLIFLDYMMPGMDGVELLKALRELPRFNGVPVVMVTGQEDRASRYRALEAGANDFITKPVDELELVVRTRNMLTLRANARDLYRLATTDELTNLANRRHFLSRLEDELARAYRHPQHLPCLAIFDIDHFKRINDTYGHATGDMALEGVSAICRNLLRKVDAIGRIGGEEFAILLPSTSMADAAAVCDRLRELVQATPIHTPRHDVNLTISIGLAEFMLGEESSQLLARADRALYQAKNGGRNRLELAAA